MAFPVMVAWHARLPARPNTRQATILAGVLGYTVYLCGFKLRGRPEQPWQGWQLGEAAAGWREYLRFGAPAAIMICLEWWSVSEAAS
jgi:hypothetical protein